VQSLRGEAEDDAELASVLAEARHEIDVYRRCGHSYGYAFFVLRRDAGPPRQAT
jgi:hypothetical protein